MVRISHPEAPQALYPASSKGISIAIDKAVSKGYNFQGLIGWLFKIRTDGHKKCLHFYT
jgi:hypothetical protein